METYLEDEYRNVLITGGAGFIGGALVRRLLLESNLRILNIDKLSYASDLTSIDNVLVSKLITKNRYEFVNADLADSNQLSNIFTKFRPDLIFHLAAETHVDRSIDSPYPFVKNNIIGTYNILEAARKYFINIENSKFRQRFRFIHISTDEVFGSLGESGMFTELSKYDPRSPYSASKASSDHFVNAWHHTYQLPTIITNCGNNFGPWQYPEKLIPLTINKALSGEEIPVYGNGKNIRDWLFVEDHVNAILLSAKKGIPGNQYCIGGYGEMSNLKLVKKICTILDNKLPRRTSYEELITFVEDRPGHDFRYSIDSSKAYKDLGWESNYDIDNSLILTINWYIENQDWSNKVSFKTSYNGTRLGLNS